MSEPRALVKNAADPEQVKHARRKERDRDEMLNDAIRASLQHSEVRIVFAHLLEIAGLFKTSFDHSGSIMYWNEGRRNFGLEIRSLLERADERLVDLMDTERRQRQRALDRETDAAHASRQEAVNGG